MYFIKLLRLVPNEQSAVMLLQEYGIILKDRVCKNGHEMTLSLKYLRWICSTCRNKIRIRTGTWLECTRLPINKILYFIYWWSEGMTSVKFTKRQLKIAQASVIEFNYSLREVCLWKMSKESKISPQCIKDNHNAETIWRNNLNEFDPFEQILRDIASFRPPV